jgi:hypothetical protein
MSTHAPLLRRAVTLLVGVLACGTAGACAGHEESRTARGATAVAQVGTPPVTTERILDGEPWSEAEKYLRKLRFASDFPMSDLQSVMVCSAGCPVTDLTVMADSNVRYLANAHLPGFKRVLAKVVLHVPGTRIPRLGFTADNATGESFLLLLPDGSARFMYNGAGKIRLTTPWRFLPPMGHHQYDLPMAKWLHLPDREVRIKVDKLYFDTHLAGIWMACAEGCCVAQAQ